MLVLLVGPSGAGKTPLMEGLCNRFDCELLSNFTSRPLRPGEQSRYYLSESDALAMHHRGELQFLNEVFGNLCGSTRQDYAAALRSTKVFLFDVHWSHLHKILDSATCIVFLPGDSEAELIGRLAAVGREDRIAEVVAERKEVLALFGRLSSQKNVISIDPWPRQADDPIAWVMEQILAVLDASLKGSEGNV